MGKRAAVRRLNQAAEANAFFEDAGKVRPLRPQLVRRDWDPLDADPAPKPAPRDQSFVKHVRPKSPGQAKLMEAIDQHALVMALGPAGTGKTYLAIAKAVERWKAAGSGGSCYRDRRSKRARAWAFCRAIWKTSSRLICARSMTPCRTGYRQSVSRH
jgi:Phosphate starvation-inducible protein PhoH, predicted ATPase